MPILNSGKRLQEGQPNDFAIAAREIPLRIRTNGYIGRGASGGRKIVTVTRSGTGQSVKTEYFKHGLRRTDQVSEFQGTRRESTVVLDLVHFWRTVWDPKLKQYTITKLTHAKPEPATGPEIVIDRSTVDTGAENLLRISSAAFDHPRNARGAPPTAWDGWYIDSKSLPIEKRARLVSFAAANGARLRFIVNQTGPALNGLAVWEKITSSYDGTERTIEVTELTEAPLPEQIFSPPAGFRLAATPWESRFEFTWKRLEEWLSSLLN